jgi:hypothetical protein
MRVNEILRMNLLCLRSSARIDSISPLIHDALCNAGHHCDAFLPYKHDLFRELGLTTEAF